MNTQSPATRPNSCLSSKRDQRGFALIATISVMSLLVMIALAMLSLSSIEVRQSSNANAKATAQANARLALMVAIGRLQTLSGPDQRVTAPAELAGSINNPHWLGVWKTTTSTSGGSKPVIALDSDDSTFIDERNGQDRIKDYQLGWLVSGENPDPSQAMSGDVVRIVGDGSVSDNNDRVDVAIEQLTDSAGNVSGAMAYWVSDESTKARIDLADRYKNEQPKGSDYDTGGFRRLLSPERFGVSFMDGLQGYDALEDDDLPRILSVSQGSLSGMDLLAAKKQYHGLTTSSMGIFTDTLRSGLKVDLSVFLEDGQIAALSGISGSAINGDTPLLEGDRRKNVGPRMGILRSWANLADVVGGGRDVPEIAPKALEQVISSDKYGKYPDISKLQSQPVHPVIAHATVTTRMSYIRGYLAVHLYPRIVLWNPYNVKLEAQQYVVDFNHFVQDSMTVEKRKNGTTDVGNFAYDTRNSGNSARRMVLTTDATAFEPGEALVFSPLATSGTIGGNAVRLNYRTSSGKNMISATVPPSSLTNFYINLGRMNGVTKSDLPVYANHNRGAYYWVDMMDWWWANDDNGLKVGLHLLDGNLSNYNDLTSSHKLLQLIDTDNWHRGYQGRFNNGRWKVGGVEPIYDYETTSTQLPWARTSYGIRFKWMRETNPYNMAGGGAGAFWHASPVANYNVRAALCHRSPYDTVCDNGESHHWYNYGPYAVDRQQSLPPTHSDFAAHPGPNGYRSNVFFAGSSTNPNQVYPLFDVPGSGYQVHSVGAFRHAQLSTHIWQPSYAVGSSLAPINLFQRERTAAAHSAMASQWKGDMPFLPSWMMLKDKSSVGADDDHFVYDLAYEANHALWDKYFLSTGTKKQKTEFIADPANDPLPNTRIIPLAGADESTLHDGRKAATKLALKGAFNVNSTNKQAWKALLASFSGVEVSTVSGSSTGSDGGHPFPRFLKPPQTKFNGDGPEDLKTWAGYRSLSDTEIDQLAGAIVSEVKRRGPFVSVSDFVNRRLVSATSTDREMGLQGTLDAAIANTDLNSTLLGGVAAMPQSFGGTDESYSVESRSNSNHFNESKVEGSPGWLMQGDILQQVGSVLTARGDTFKVRAYGEARDTGGRVLARAWCEAVVQRTPDYLDSSDVAELPAMLKDGTENTSLSEVNRKFGRRYIISSFRWLSPTEV